ncbi:MAG: hypothetical protein VR73_05315 [Gammaproteobacteria bacterium BRH_c0]|nr:MAG: hypothetical protein VR73_05315 [Gammaproteobacteria bacterium BRH_c0]
MNNSRTTPRTNKARDALRQAMIELLVEKPYGDIRVQDIAQRAGISRSSFYVYFRDKDDLLISGFEEIGVTSYDDLFEVNDNDPYYPNFAIVLFRGSEQQKDMSRALLNLESSNPASLHMRNMLVIKTREWLKSINPKLPESDLESTVHYLASALQGLLTWWVSNNFPYPADTISQHFNRLAVSGLQGLLHLAPEPSLQSPQD